jgi:acylphosphatase
MKSFRAVAVLSAAVVLGWGMLVPGRGLGQAPSAASRPAKALASASAPSTASAPAVRSVHVFVSGKVQGVGFRDWTVGEARALQLTGWVRNRLDGRVEAVIEGPSASVATMLEKLKKGPRTANVTNVESTDQAPKGEFKSFERR